MDTPETEKRQVRKDSEPTPVVEWKVEECRKESEVPPCSGRTFCVGMGGFEKESKPEGNLRRR